MRLRFAVPEVWEQWAHRHQPWETDPERPAQLKEGLLLPGKIPRLWLPTGHILRAPIRGGARFFDSTDDTLNADSTPVTAAPFSMAAWAKPDEATTSHTVIFIGDKDVTTDLWALQMRGDVAGDPVRFISFDSPAIGQPDTSAGFTAAWHHVIGVELASNSRAVYLNGGSKGTDATSVTPDGADRIRIGSSGTSSPGTFFGGDIAEVAVWDVDLGDDGALMHSKGVSALMVRPASLVFYCPIIGKYSPEIDVIGGRSMTVTGAVASAHPRIFYMPALPTLGGPTPVVAATAVGPLIGGKLAEASMLVTGRIVR